MHLIMSSVKRRPFCLGLGELTANSSVGPGYKIALYILVNTFDYGVCKRCPFCLGLGELTANLSVEPGYAICLCVDS